MPGLSPLLIVVIVVTAIISYKGFHDFSFFNQYMFRVDAIRKRKEYIRLLSAGFLHADWMHLGFNMLTLYFFTGIVLMGFGSIGFLIIYIGSIVVGNLFSLYIYKNDPSYSAIGASGGVSGVLFAAIAMNPFMKIGFIFVPIPISGYIFGALYFGYSVYMMLNPKQWDNLGHAAHLGGSVVGLIVAFIMYPMESMEHIVQIGIMALPLLYLGYRILVKRLH